MQEKMLLEGPDDTDKQPHAAHHPHGTHHRRRHLRIFGRRVPVPQSVAMRRTLGGLLIAGGTLGFLPILGFWMVPLGLVVLSHDSAIVRRKRRQIEVKLGRRWKGGWFGSDKSED
ncbi:hypothetical protein DEV91_12470 [Phyllobacterium brassicacearum]|nr:hypothetical protein DEV91_12470 [Phyllobacterium brassicacearum]